MSNYRGGHCTSFAGILVIDSILGWRNRRALELPVSLQRKSAQQEQECGSCVHSSWSNNWRRELLWALLIVGKGNREGEKRGSLTAAVWFYKHVVSMKLRRGITAMRRSAKRTWEAGGASLCHYESRDDMFLKQQENTFQQVMFTLGTVPWFWHHSEL